MHTATPPHAGHPPESALCSLPSAHSRDYSVHCPHGEVHTQENRLLLVPVS